MAKEIEMQGGCACGAVRYQTQAKPNFSYFCQCRQCLQLTGTGHSASCSMTKPSPETIWIRKN